MLTHNNTTEVFMSFEPAMAEILLLCYTCRRQMAFLLGINESQLVFSGVRMLAFLASPQESWLALINLQLEVTECYTACLAHTE